MVVLRRIYAPRTQIRHLRPSPLILGVEAILINLAEAIDVVFGGVLFLSVELKFPAGQSL